MCGELGYNAIFSSFCGWIAHARQANTYNFGRNIKRIFENTFPGRIADVQLAIWLKNIKAYI